MIQSAFLLGYMATQLWGGGLADELGGKVVMALGIAWYSAASILTPLALSAPVQAVGLALPALLLARTCVVSNVESSYAFSVKFFVCCTVVRVVGTLKHHSNIQGRRLQTANIKRFHNCKIIGISAADK